MKKKLILMVDDDPEDVEIFACAIEGKNLSGVSFVSASSGIEALNLIKNADFNPDLILLDIGMPKMNGWECLKLFKQNKTIREIPVIITATSSREKDIEHAYQLGAACYFVKPADYNQLKDIMHGICLGLEDGLEKNLNILSRYSSENIFVQA